MTQPAADPGPADPRPPAGFGPPPDAGHGPPPGAAGHGPPPNAGFGPTPNAGFGSPLSAARFGPPSDARFGPAPEAGVGAIIAAVLSGAWAVLIAFLSQSGGWLTVQVTLALGLDLPGVVWPAIALVSALLAGGPALLVWLIPRHPAIRAAGRVWTIGAIALGIGTALRAIPGTENELYLALLALIFGVLAFGLTLLLRRPAIPPRDAHPGLAEHTLSHDAHHGLAEHTPPHDTHPGLAEHTPPRDTHPGLAEHTPPRDAHGGRAEQELPSAARHGGIGEPAVNRWWAVAAGLLVLLPFLWSGALGGWLETIAAVAAAAAIGALAGSILDSRFWTTYEPGPWRRIVLGGLVGGVALALIGAGAGGNGVQLLLLFLLPGLAFAAAALRRTAPLVGIAAFGPLAFVDPVEVNFFLLGEDVPFWAAVSAAVGWIIALAVGLFYAIARNPLARVKRPIAMGAATALALGAGALYAVGGQPGFYGDQLFVVLKNQAPLSGLPTTTGLGPGRDERVTAVYRRLVEHAEREQAGLRRELDRLRVAYQPYYLVNGILVNGGPELRIWLESRPEVDRVLLDQRLRPLPRPVSETFGDITEPPKSPQWNIEMVGAPQAWAQGARGQQIVVGGSDSGADGKHPALAAGYRGGDDSWHDPWNNTDFPVDNGGHGTHTLATAVGKENVGVAPSARWVACVNLDRNMGSPSFYLDCMQFMLAPFAKGGDPFRDGRPARAPHVLTNSWGCTGLEGCDEQALVPATDALAAAGIAFVAAAGNAGDRCGSIDEAPATDPAALTVAAVDDDGAVAAFSSRGQPASGKPDLAAPGAHVLSAMPGDTYGYMDGTSMATPHAAGVVALLWSAHPELVGDLQRTYRILRANTDPVTSMPTCGDLEDGGAGIINAGNALEAMPGVRAG